MGRLIDILVGIVSGLVTGELTAHGEPLARWIIESAVRRLDTAKRERFREEWFAHLEETPGILRKIWHAVGCYVCSAKLGKISEDPPFQMIRIEYGRFGSVELNYATYMFVREFLPKCGFALNLHFAGRRLPRFRRILATLAFVDFTLRGFFCLRRLRKFGSVDPLKAGLLLELTANSIAAKNTERVFYIDGRRIDDGEEFVRMIGRR